METTQFEQFEPLKTNRWLIEFDGMNIKPYLFRKYKIYNEGENMIFTTEFLETVLDTINPKEFFNIVGVKIQYLDSTGAVVNGLQFDIKGMNFEQKMSYGKDKFKTTKLKFIINSDTILPLHIIEKKDENK
jgi:hypothetical protein